MGKRIYLHAGAHRTGSSSFQLCLHENRAVLNRLGYDIAYPGRDDVPGGRLKLRLPAPRHGAKRLAPFAASVRAALERFSPDPERALILSEENLSGRMFHLYQGRFFPAAAKRFSAVRDGLGAARIEIAFVVRPYAGLYVSAYRKRAEDNAVDPFAGIVPALLRMDRGWPELVAEMRDILRPERMVVVDYARRGESRDLLARLIPDRTEAGFAEPARTMNLSATDAALADLQARYHAGESLKRADWQAVLRAYADDDADRGFARLDADARAALDARYAGDLERLAGMAGVEMG